jgi:preprotein translocase subunit SecG
MTTLLIIIHVFVSLFLIVIVLLQHGKGADIGATFGGSSQSLMGTEGAVPLLNKITTFAAIVFMGTSISLAYLSANQNTGTVMKDVAVKQDAAPAPAAAEKTPVTIPMPETKSAAPAAAPAEAPKAQ